MVGYRFGVKAGGRLWFGLWWGLNLKLQLVEWNVFNVPFWNSAPRKYYRGAVPSVPDPSKGWVWTLGFWVKAGGRLWFGSRRLSKTNWLFIMPAYGDRIRTVRTYKRPVRRLRSTGTTIVTERRFRNAGIPRPISNGARTAPVNLTYIMPCSVAYNGGGQVSSQFYAWDAQSVVQALINGPSSSMANFLASYEHMALKYFTVEFSPLPYFINDLSASLAYAFYKDPSGRQVFTSSPIAAQILGSRPDAKFAVSPRRLRESMNVTEYVKSADLPYWQATNQLSSQYYTPPIGTTLPSINFAIQTTNANQSGTQVGFFKVVCRFTFRNVKAPTNV